MWNIFSYSKLQLRKPNLLNMISKIYIFIKKIDVKMKFCLHLAWIFRTSFVCVNVVLSCLIFMTSLPAKLMLLRGRRRECVPHLTTNTQIDRWLCFPLGLIFKTTCILQAVENKIGHDRRTQAASRARPCCFFYPDKWMDRKIHID